MGRILEKRRDFWFDTRRFADERDLFPKLGNGKPDQGKTLKHRFAITHNRLVSKTASFSGDKIPYRQYWPTDKSVGSVK